VSEYFLIYNSEHHGHAVSSPVSYMRDTILTEVSPWFSSVPQVKCWDTLQNRLQPYPYHLQFIIQLRRTIWHIICAVKKVSLNKEESFTVVIFNIPGLSCTESVHSLNWFSSSV